jgi:hypothetical protein
MGEVQDTENDDVDDVDDTNENERPPQPKIQADGIQPRLQTNSDANENQRSPRSELEPENGSNANNESPATSPKDKDSSPLSADPDQEQFQTSEPIKVSLRSQVSSRPESNARVSSSLPGRSTASGLPPAPASNPATVEAVNTNSWTTFEKKRRSAAQIHRTICEGSCENGPNSCSEHGRGGTSLPRSCQT